MVFGRACQAEGSTGWQEEGRAESSCCVGLVVAEVPCGVSVGAGGTGRVKEGLECQGEALRVLKVFDWGWA